jgi:protein ImuB
MVLCIHLPRFELLAAAHGGSAQQQQQQQPGRSGTPGTPPRVRIEAERARYEGGGRTLLGRALALAPLTGAEQRVGETSGAAEACGVRAGMALGEALARCPDLILLPPDPVGVAETWESVLRSLEAIGAAVEPARPGLVCFAADGLRRLHGSDGATIAAAQRAGRYPFGGGRARVGAGPTRFCALAGALAVRSRRPVVVSDGEARRWLAGRPVQMLGYRHETEALVGPLGCLGVRTLGELARLGRSALADRFGAAGALAHRLACGEDTPLRPRHLEERLRETMAVGDASSGPALERVLGVLLDRLLARPERRGRALCAVTLSARLIAGGAWRERAVFRQALCDSERIGLALSARLRLLPAPAATLGLTVERFGPAPGEQSALLDRDRAARAARLREAVGQMRAVAGREAALRAVCVDPDSRVPERRVMLTPIPG